MISSPGIFRYAIFRWVVFLGFSWCIYQIPDYLASHPGGWTAIVWVPSSVVPVPCGRAVQAWFCGISGRGAENAVR